MDASAQAADRELRARRMLDASADGLVHVGPLGQVLDANQTMCRMLGRAPPLVAGSGFADCFAEREQAAKAIDLTVAMGRITDYALTLVDSGGRRLPVSLNAVVLPGGEAEVLVSVRESTDQQELERQLRDAIDRARSLIESSRDMLVTTDDAGGITDLNRQMEALTGRSRGELIGTPFAALFAEPGAADQVVQATLRDGAVSDAELTITHTTGRQTTIDCNAAILRDRHGGAAGLIVTARDMTERKRLEQALRAANVELELANRGKDSFLASTSHELRTPLNGILGFTDILLSEQPGRLNDEQRGQLRIIQYSARHLLSIINDLLDLAMIEQGSWEGDFQPASCREVADEVAAALAPLARDKGLALRVDCVDDDLVAVVDRRALTQILINLVSNAIKFTERGGVRIAVGSRERHGAPAATFDVIDSGIGIPREEQQRLFLAFVRVGQPGAATVEGTGLGLHISRRLADHLGGTITFESEPGAGSRFSLELPCAGPARMRRTICPP
ncbi:MAG TPA: PAS domain S-box protein [Candidatus Dormibacteraeota bacterium]